MPESHARLIRVATAAAGGGCIGRGIASHQPALILVGLFAIALVFFLIYLEHRS